MARIEEEAEEVLKSNLGMEVDEDGEEEGKGEGEEEGDSTQGALRAL